MFNYDTGGGIRYDSNEYVEKILLRHNEDGGPGARKLGSFRKAWAARRFRSRWRQT